MSQILGPFFSILVFSFLYLLPTTIAYGRRDHGRMRWQWILLINVLIAWTVIGWVACFLLVAYYFPGPARSSAGVPLPTGGGSSGLGSTTYPCSACSGGRARCGLCGGQRGRWEGGTWANCTYCLGSGAVQCMSCGGSGVRSLV